VEVCNAALSLLGAARITDLTTDTSQGAILCNLFYSQCRDTVMSAYPWNFATKRKALGTPLASSDADAPIWGYTYGFTLPTVPYCLRVLETENYISYRVEGRVLYADESSLNIRYIARVESPAQFSDGFKVTLCANIAMYLAMPITKSKSLMDAMSALYTFQLAQAEQTDTQEGTPDEIDSDELLIVRGGEFLSRTESLIR
jgi:hypothetical protein